MSTHPKLYLVDPGVFRSLRPKGPLDAQHLRAWIAYAGTEDTLSFWRTRGGSEVGFVLYGESGMYAIEVKNRKTFHPRDLTGLRALAHDYPGARAVLLYRGSRRYRQGSVLCLPCEEYLRSLQPGKSFAGIIESS